MMLRPLKSCSSLVIFILWLFTINCQGQGQPLNVFQLAGSSPYTGVAQDYFSLTLSTIAPIPDVPVLISVSSGDNSLVQPVNSSFLIGPSNNTGIGVTFNLFLTKTSALQIPVTLTSNSSVYLFNNGQSTLQFNMQIRDNCGTVKLDACPTQSTGYVFLSVTYRRSLSSNNVLPTLIIPRNPGLTVYSSFSPECPQSQLAYSGSYNSSSSSFFRSLGLSAVASSGSGYTVYSPEAGTVSHEYGLVIPGVSIGATSIKVNYLVAWTGNSSNTDGCAGATLIAADGSSTTNGFSSLTCTTNLAISANSCVAPVFRPWMISALILGIIYFIGLFFFIKTLNEYTESNHCGFLCGCCPGFTYSKTYKRDKTSASMMLK